VRYAPATRYQRRWLALSPARRGATYKAFWTKVKQNAAQRQAGKTKKRYKGLDQPPKYVSPTLTYQLGHDYGFKTDQRVSILTLQGRLILLYTGYDQHVALIEHGAQIGAAQLWYDKPKKQFYLLVSLEVEVADPTPETQTSMGNALVKPVHGMFLLTPSASIPSPNPFALLLYPVGTHS